MLDPMWATIHLLSMLALPVLFGWLFAMAVGRVARGRIGARATEAASGEVLLRGTIVVKGDGCPGEPEGASGPKIAARTSGVTKSRARVADLRVDSRLRAE